MIKLVLSDIDDTLVAYGLPHATQRSMDAIRAVQDAGICFAVATGRMPWDLDWLFPNDPSATATSICDNGQIVALDGEVVLQRELNRRGLEKVVAVLDGDPRASLVLSEKGHRCVVGPLTRDDPGAGQGKGSFWEPPEQVDDVPERPWLKANIPTATVADVVPVRQLLSERVPEFAFVSPNPTANLIDILPRGWGKDKAADFLRRQLGLSLDEVLVFGDADNDLPLVRWARHSVAVANASPALAAAAERHIGPASEDAVADELFRLARKA